MKRIVVLVVLFVLPLVSCTAQGGSGSVGSIRVSGAWAREALAMGGMDDGGANGAAYMVIENTGASVDRLVKVESDAAANVELHQSLMEGDVMKMLPVEAVEIPGKGKAELQPGSYHVMLLGLKQDLKEGEKIHLKLTFESAGVLELDAEIRNP